MPLSKIKICTGKRKLKKVVKRKIIKYDLDKFKRNKHCKGIKEKYPKPHFENEGWLMIPLFSYYT